MASLLRLLATMSLLTISLLASPAHASHTEEGGYTIGSTPGVSLVCSPNCAGIEGANIGGYTFEADPETPVNVTIIDQTGGPVAFTVCQDFDGALCGGDGEPRVVGCGNAADLSTSAVAFRPNVATSVFVRSVDPSCAGTAFGGAIQMMFA